MWMHVTCVNLSEKETIGFWVCPTCRELPRTVLKISEQLDAVNKNNMDLVRDTAAKIVRIHELEAENKRLRKMYIYYDKSTCNKNMIRQQMRYH
jgi:hypothetical protein